MPIGRYKFGSRRYDRHGSASSTSTGGPPRPGIARSTTDGSSPTADRDTQPGQQAIVELLGQPPQLLDRPIVQHPEFGRGDRPIRDQPQRNRQDDVGGAIVAQPLRSRAARMPPAPIGMGRRRRPPTPAGDRSNDLPRRRLDHFGERVPPADFDPYPRGLLGVHAVPPGAANGRAATRRGRRSSDRLAGIDPANRLCPPRGGVTRPPGRAGRLESGRSNRTGDGNVVASDRGRFSATSSGQESTASVSSTPGSAGPSRPNRPRAAIALRGKGIVRPDQDRAVRDEPGAGRAAADGRRHGPAGQGVADGHRIRKDDHGHRIVRLAAGGRDSTVYPTRPRPRPHVAVDPPADQVLVVVEPPPGGRAEGEVLGRQRQHDGFGDGQVEERIVIVRRQRVRQPVHSTGREQLLDAGRMPRRAASARRQRCKRSTSGTYCGAGRSGSLSLFVGVEDPGAGGVQDRAGLLGPVEVEPAGRHVQSSSRNVCCHSGPVTAARVCSSDRPPRAGLRRSARADVPSGP